MSKTKLFYGMVLVQPVHEGFDMTDSEPPCVMTPPSPGAGQTIWHLCKYGITADMVF